MRGRREEAGGWGGADEMVAAGAGTLWREGRQRLVVCVFW